ncbi:MAG: antibiotic biosynthesis monooxygenase [Hyphomicrobiales bacterium]|nr:MAG: antibiotic biosynthesis monooxygenase [Hyphomicrobiales bacterium]
MADESLVRMAELEIFPARLEEYLTFLTEEISASVEREPGVHMLHAVADKAEPHKIRILEVYASRAAYEAHIETPHFLKYKLGTTDMVAGLRLIDMDPIILASR